MKPCCGVQRQQQLQQLYAQQRMDAVGLSLSCCIAINSKCLTGPLHGDETTAQLRVASCGTSSCIRCKTCCRTVVRCDLKGFSCHVRSMLTAVYSRRALLGICKRCVTHLSCAVDLHSEDTT